MATLRPFRIMLDRGLELDGVEQGDVDGMPMVLLHGYSDTWRSFEPLLSRLPARIRAVAVSQRGHGDSAKPTTGYRPSDFADDLAVLLNRLDIPRAVVVGHSMGSLVAERFALDHAGRVAGLVLIGAFRRLKGNTAMDELWRNVIDDIADPVDPAFVREFQKSTLATPVPSLFMETVIAESLKMPAHVWRKVAEGLMAEDFSAELRRIVAPTLIIWGERDGFSDRHEQVALEMSIRNARPSTFAGIGHSPHWEVPDRAAAEIAAFVAAITATA